MKFPADLITFTEEILNGKLQFFVYIKLLSEWEDNLRKFYVAFLSMQMKIKLNLSFLTLL